MDLHPFVLWKMSKRLLATSTALAEACRLIAFLNVVSIIRHEQEWPIFEISHPQKREHARLGKMQPGKESSAAATSPIVTPENVTACSKGAIEQESSTLFKTSC